jgi:hypothetical protein
MGRTWTLPGLGHMMAAMRRVSPFRRLTALAAAYVVALQIALLPLTVVAAGSPLAAPLCSELVVGKSNPATSATGDVGCACASGCGASCCAPALAGPTSATTAIDRTSFAVLTPKAMAIIPGFVSRHDPQNPRAPPRSAA